MLIGHRNQTIISFPNLTLVPTRDEKSISLSDLLLVYAFTFSLVTCSLESRGGFDDFVVILMMQIENDSHSIQSGDISLQG